MSIDVAITSTHILHLSRSKVIQQNTRCGVTPTGIGVVWWHQKDPLGAVSAGYSRDPCKGTTSNYSMRLQGMHEANTNKMSVCIRWQMARVIKAKVLVINTQREKH